MEFQGQGEEETDYGEVVETLRNMFGDVVSRDVIVAVVESYNGDLNFAAEAIMNISSDTDGNNDIPIKDQPVTEHVATPGPSTIQNRVSTSNESVPSTPQGLIQPTMSYAGISTSMGAVPKKVQNSRPTLTIPPLWTGQLQEILAYHNQGARILILMRGVPGSGKSFLARQIIEMTIGSTFADYKTHICSTDDFFMLRGQYIYEKYRLSEAHEWNQNRVQRLLMKGLSPVIVDNTNIEIWEMEPYLRYGVKNGYIIEVVEPNTPWARKVGQLVRKNSHNVPAQKIKKMLENYQEGVTGRILIRQYGLSYPANMVPPVIRNMPHFISLQSSTQPKEITIAQSDGVNRTDVRDFNTQKETTQQENQVINIKTHSPTQLHAEASVFVPTVTIIPVQVETKEEEQLRKERYLEIEKQIEEIEKVDREWETNEGWEDESQETVKRENEVLAPPEPQPQRRTISEELAPSIPRNQYEALHKVDDWRKISMFMPSWADDSSSEVGQSDQQPVPETNSTGTCMQSGDTDLNNPKKKIMIATPRDINLFTTTMRKEKIPAVRMLDKSSMTNELLITEAYRCKNEEQHFVAFRKLFKNVPRASLRDIFDKCCGDVNWAVDIVLEGMAADKLQIVENNDQSDTEEEVIKENQCNCLAAYHIIPDAEPGPNTNNQVNVEQPNIPTTAVESNLPLKKTKLPPSDTVMQMKRQIEQNIVISDDHYSEHALKLRKWRRGEYLLEPQPSTSNDFIEEQIPQTKLSTAQSDDEESNTSSLDDVEKTVNVNVGFEFIEQLDYLFGRAGMAYPDNVVPRINIPIRLLNEINAFWIESLTWQLDEREKQSAKILTEDSEFARQLEMKEAELAQQGKEPEIPDFKEIMDMDFALSLYQKDVAEWKNKEPKDLAAKLSRDKLYNLFPDMSQEVLSELLMAHDNNFQATVEILLMSTGKSHILEEKNGLNKFVMVREMERQERLLEEEKKALSEVEWPLLPKAENVDLNQVNNYRLEAEQHLARRDLNYRKAQEYIRRGMTQVASYYSDIATFHTQKYEQANSMAAATLMQVHAMKSPDNATIDLHFLRVAEAKESLDLFLDTHIQKLRESNNKVHSQTLYLITGRGLHSSGGPRVKPAVRKRLRERGLVCSEGNPGLLIAKVTADDKLSHQLLSP